MQTGTISQNSASPHWLEHLSENLARLPADVRRTAYALLRSPWDCSSKDVRKYVPAPLADSIICLQHSVLRHVFRKNRLLSLRKSMHGLWFGALLRHADGSSEPLTDNAIIAADVYTGLAKEDLAKNGILWNDLSGVAHASLLALYVSCDTAVHLMAEMFETAGGPGDELRYSIPAHLRAAHKMRWFGLYWAQQSNMADTYHALAVSHGLKQIEGPTRYSELFQVWVNSVLDKFLCLHKDYISQLEKSKHGTVIPELWARAELLCFIWMQFITTGLDRSDFAGIVLDGHPLTTISHEHFLQAGFSSRDVDTLLAESVAQPPGDQLITLTADKRHLQVHNLNLKFSLQRYLQSHLTTIGNSIGDWFERDYILQFLPNRLESSRFKAWPGIKDEEKKYDADIVIHDAEEDLFYFCQVKHRREVIQPYLRDELEEYNRGPCIPHGIDQLVRLRELIDTKEVRDRLVGSLGKKLIDAKPLGERSRFLLIHTVENFDMCTKSGITMYEWNTFRNLLQGQVLFAKRDLEGTSKYGTVGLDFSNVDAVQNHLMDVSGKLMKDIAPDQPNPEDMYERLQQVELTLQYQNAFWVNGEAVAKSMTPELRVPLL